MKKLFIIALLFIPISGYCQLLDGLPTDENGKLYFSEVVQLDSVPKDVIYLQSNQFFMDIFKSSKDVIQFDDKEAGILVGKGFSTAYFTAWGSNKIPIQLWYTIKIQSKEGRYKYEIYNLEYKSSGDSNGLTPEVIFNKNTYYKKNGEPNQIFAQYKIITIVEIQNIIKSIKTTMAKGEIAEW